MKSHEEKLKYGTPTQSHFFLSNFLLSFRIRSTSMRQKCARTAKETVFEDFYEGFTPPPLPPPLLGRKIAYFIGCASCDARGNKAPEVDASRKQLTTSNKNNARHISTMAEKCRRRRGANMLRADDKCERRVTLDEGRSRWTNPDEPTPP